ncbi:MAG TPA: pitrilysin family protein [Gaiellales bacterium]|nr:pitrilysin family protein [Gaiellales bacterium]
MQRYTMTTLDGGERIVTERVRSVRSVALGIWIGAGSRDETAERAGISHFIEHLLFKGSSRYSGVQIAQVFDGLGGELNAATAKEYTVLYARVLDAHLETALDVMGDMLLAPTFDADELNSEREVVLEEIAMYEDSFHDLAHDLIAGAVFGDHPLGRPVIGTSGAVNAIDTAMVREYHGNRYVGPNIVIAAAGNLEHEPLVHAIQQRFEAYTKVPDPSAGVRPVWVGESSPQTVFQAKPSEQYHVCLAGIGLQRSDRRRFAASLLDSMLGGSASSRLFQEIRERRGMAYSVYTFGSQYADTGMVGVYVGTREDNLAECMRITADQLVRMGQGEFADDELQRSKENLKGRIMLSMESTSNRASRLGKSVLTDTELLSLDRICAEIDSVEPEAVASLARQLFAPDRLSVSGVGPDEDRFREAVAALNPALA